MSIKEYLYIDEKRLESYFEQVSSPLHYDKIPTWKISLGITSASVETNLDKRGREFTRHEKVQAIMEHLEKNDLVDIYRPADEERWHSKKIFRLETCRAIRVYIPPKIEAPLPFLGLGLWISYIPHPKHRNPNEKGRPAGALYLLEDFQGEDKVYARANSSFSALGMLLGVTGDSGDFVIDFDLGNDGLNFSSHPDKFFGALGVKLEEARLIHTLYRVRATCNDRYSQPRYAVTTVGYPLFIAEG
jgi:hypothetical protein